MPLYIIVRLRDMPLYIIMRTKRHDIVYTVKFNHTTVVDIIVTPALIFTYMYVTKSIVLRSS